MTLDELLGLDENKAQFHRLREQLLNPGILPFVGAGMSVPCGLPGWVAFLSDAGRRAGTSEEVDGRIASGKYEEAADAIAKGMGERRWLDYLDETFGPAAVRDEQIKGPALFIPKLTGGPVITTNFDRVLERVFTLAGRPFEERVHGAKPDLVRLAIFSNKPYLIKIHGDILDRTDRVLTLAEYRDRYGSESVEEVDLTQPFPRVLRQVFSSRTLLFLGCSLLKDRTVLLLRRVVKESGAPPPHFAILEQPKDSTASQARARFLAELNVRPIWYPAHRHEAVETILRGLVEPSRAEPRRPHSVPAIPSISRRTLLQILAIGGTTIGIGVGVSRRFHPPSPSSPPTPAIPSLRKPVHHPVRVLTGLAPGLYSNPRSLVVHGVLPPVGKVSQNHIPGVRTILEKRLQGLPDGKAPDLLGGANAAREPVSCLGGHGGAGAGIAGSWHQVRSAAARYSSRRHVQRALWWSVEYSPL